MIYLSCDLCQAEYAKKIKKDKKGRIYTVEILAEYLETECIRLAAFAEKIGCSPCNLRLIAHKGRIPSLLLAYEIEKYTYGRVTMQDMAKEALKLKKI